jgi:hypothetical protein
MTPTDITEGPATGLPDPIEVTARREGIEPGATPDRGRRRPVDPLRLACHLAAELPFLVLCLVKLSSGWQPTSDDAISSWRAWNVVSPHPTLLGAPTHGLASAGHPVFAPGPMVSWLLALPTHLDPLHGTLWGSAVIGALGAGVAVESGRAAAARRGMALCAGAVLILASTQVGVVLDPLWTPWIGAVWYLATLAAAWATGCGRLGWWVVVVVAASLTAQAHVIFAIPVAGLCLASAVVGAAVGGGSPSAGGHRRWIVAGLGCATFLWLPTLIDQVADSPGNITLLWRSSQQSAASLGFRLAFSGLSSATGAIPSWVHRVPTPDTLSSFFRIEAIGFGGSALWGGTVVTVLLVVATLATLRGHRQLAAAAWIAAVASVLTVVAVASVPQSDAIEIFYLSVVYVPVGIMAWLVMAAGVLQVFRWGLSRLRAPVAGDGEAPTSRPPRWRPAMRSRAGGLAVVVLLVASAIVTVSIGPLVPSDQSELGGPSAVRATATAASLVEAKVGRSVPLELDIVGGSSPAGALIVYWGIAYAVFVTGRPIRLDKQLAPYVGSSPEPATPSPTTVTVVLDRNDRVIAVRAQPLGRATAYPPASRGGNPAR